MTDEAMAAATRSGAATAMLACVTADRSSGPDQLLDEQIARYRAIAQEYEDHAIPFAGADELHVALDAFRPVGTVLELACGQGLGTGRLLRHADEVTAVDAPPEMLAIASSRVGSERVRFVHAHIFDWEPGPPVRLLLGAGGELPQAGWSGLLRRRCLPHPRRTG